MPQHDLWTEIAQALEAGRIGRRDFLRECIRWGLSAPAASAFLHACAPGDRPERSGRERGLEDRLNIYNWSDYVAEETIPGFERELGVKVTYDTYESNEELLAKIQAGASGYDIIVPSNYIVEILIAAGQLDPLSQEWLPNLPNLAPRFRSPPYDAGNRYSVPYQWGTSGIAYRSDRVRGKVDAWRVLWYEEHAGKITMLDDMREVIGAALKVLGYSLNSTDEAQLAEAKTLCIEQKRLLKAYVSAAVKPQLIAGDVWLAQLWSGDAFQAMREQPAIRYAIPKEGSAIWADNLCIPRSAPHRRAAHAFIDYVLRPPVAAAISNAVGYGCPNEAARPLIAEPLRSDPALYPPAEILDRLEWIVDLGAATRLYDRLWTEIKAT